MAEQPEKHEYCDGEVFAMAGGSPNHALVTANLTALLHVGLRPRGCRTYSSDLRVRLTESRRYVYPDLSAVCGEPEFAAEDTLSLVNPALVAEVLSPSTETFDLGTKARLYRELPSLQALLLVRQDEPAATLYRRDGDRWTVEDAVGLEAHLDVLGAPLALAEVYDGATFEAQARPGGV